MEQNPNTVILLKYREEGRLVPRMIKENGYIKKLGSIQLYLILVLIKSVRNFFEYTVLFLKISSALC